MGIVLLSLMLACPAEQLGVRLPKGGLAAMSQEDLQRDVWMLTQGPSRLPGAKDLRGLLLIEQRLSQMKTLPAFGDSMRSVNSTGWAVCGQKDGRSGEAVLVGAIDAGEGADLSASPVAGLFTLAKAYDLDAPPPHTLIFCAWSAQGGLERLRAASPVPWEKFKAVFTLGPIGRAGELKLESGELDGRPWTQFSTGPQPEHGSPEDRMEGLNFVGMLEHLEQVYRAVNKVVEE